MNTATTTQQWELLEPRYMMPGIDETTIGDNDYLLTRLRHVLDYAASKREECRASDNRLTRDIAEALEAAYLRDGLTELARELHVFTRAADEMLAMLSRRFPDIRWERRSEGFLGCEHFSTLTPGESAPRCARDLRLPVFESERPRWAGWCGNIEGFKIQIKRPREDDPANDTRLGPDLIAWLIAQAPGLPPIVWEPGGYLYGGDTVQHLALRGEVYLFAHPNADEVAARWADALGLGDASECSESGRRSYAADTEIGLVQVHWIADRERYDERMREINARDAVAPSGGDV